MLKKKNYSKLLIFKRSLIYNKFKYIFFFIKKNISESNLQEDIKNNVII